MNKSEFLNKLDKGLSCLSYEEKTGIIDYYKEIIEDKIESGMCEAGAVESVGTIEEIVKQATLENEETPEKTEKTKKLDKRWIIILIAGSPLLIPLLAAALAIGISLYVSAWVVVASVAITVAALLASTLAGAFWGIILMCTGDPLIGLLLLGCGLMCAAVGLVSLFPTLNLLKQSVKLTVKCAQYIKKTLRKGEEK